LHPPSVYCSRPIDMKHNLIERRHRNFQGESERNARAQIDCLSPTYVLQ
jgi:hypothetical protein